MRLRTKIIATPLLAACAVLPGCLHRPATPAPADGGGTLAPAWTLALDAAYGTQIAAVPGGFLVATPAGTLLKVSGSDGAVTWRKDLGAKIAGAIVVWRGAAGSPVVGTAALPLEGGDVALVALAGGDLVQRVATGWEGATVALTREKLLVVSREGVARLYGTGSGEPRWEIKLPSPPSAPGIVCSGRLMLGLEDGHLAGIDLETGALRTRKNLGSPIVVAPECRDNRLYVATADNYLDVLRLHRRRAGRKWRMKTGADPAASPLIYKSDVLLLSKDTFLYGFQRRNGHLVFRAHLDRRPGPGAILDDLVFVAGPQSTRLDAFRMPGGRGAGTFSLPEAARFITPPVASEGRVAIVVAKYGEETSKLIGLGPVPAASK
jgi:putative pyrroloquinoline-quinone binding quinoprotein